MIATAGRQSPPSPPSMPTPPKMDRPRIVRGCRFRGNRCLPTPTLHVRQVDISYTPHRNLEDAYACPACAERASAEMLARLDGRAWLGVVVGELPAASPAKLSESDVRELVESVARDLADMIATRDDLYKYSLMRLSARMAGAAYATDTLALVGKTVAAVWAEHTGVVS